MISFDTFSGPSSRVRERELDARLGFHAERPDEDEEDDAGYSTAPEPEGEVEGEARDAKSQEDDDDVFYESQDEEYDLFHERSHRQAPTARRSRVVQPEDERPERSGASPSSSESGRDEEEATSTGRIQHLVRLLALNNADSRGHGAKTALVRRLVRTLNIDELILSRASEEEIALAANEAIADEILANVDEEEQRRQSISQMHQELQDDLTSCEGGDAQTLDVTTVATDRILVAASEPRYPTALFLPGQYSPFRVLELVDVLDSSTGGMVKRVLTKVRHRAPFGQRFAKDLDKTIEFCRFCSAYSDHTSHQHRCRLCGVAGHHRSRNCPHGSSSVDSTASASPSMSTALSVRSSASNRRYIYCTFCANWGLHATERHRCRVCSAHGQHRSRSCPTKKVSGGLASRWRGSPVEPGRERKYCELCGSWRLHSSSEHRCRICGQVGDHRSKQCPQATSPSSLSPTQESPNGSTPGSKTPQEIVVHNGTAVKEFCRFCSKKVTHSSENHICRVCRAVGVHRSGDCPDRQSMLVETASKVRDRVLEKIPLVLPSAATSLVYHSLDKMGDVDTILSKTLQRIGVWGGGSQTPITTPYAPLTSSSSGNANRNHRLPSGLISPPFVINDPPQIQPDGSGAYVLSYAEGHSVVPKRILKYMRLLMHHEVSTNAFSVIVRFDPRSTHWELSKPGMVTPRSLPTSPTMSRQLKKRMAKYTTQTLLGAREKLLLLLAEQRKAELATRLETESEKGNARREPERDYARQ